MCLWSENYRLQDIQLSKNSQVPGSYVPGSEFKLFIGRKRRSGVWPVAKPREAVLPDMVENTGLEPVTSWLQTRRSPS